jgi:hypothetical protein
MAVKQQMLIAGQHSACQEIGVKIKKQEKTMQKAFEIIQNLDDVQSVKMLKQIYKDIFKAIPFDEVKRSAGDNESVSLLCNLDTDMMRHNFEPEQSVDLTKNMLLAFAEDENLFWLVINAWEKIENDDSLMIETIITLGLIANLTLFMATTEAEFEIKGVKIKKGIANAEQIKAVLSPLVELIKRIVPGAI